MTRVQEIKARLWDLRGHTCNGRLTIPRDPADKSCDGCAETIRLFAELQKLVESEHLSSQSVNQERGA